MRVIKTIEGVHVLASPQVAVPGRRLGNSARYGVGEIITLMLNGNPPQGRSMLYWNVKSGGGAITNLLVPGKCEYTAPDIGLEQLARGERSFEVRLQLVDAKGVLGEVALEIVSPQNAWLIKLGEKHQQGSANSGFWGQPCLGPNDVSFMRTLLKETRGTINTTGSVFEAARGRIHADTLGWVPASKVVDQGTLFNAPDSVLSVATMPAGGWKANNTSIAGTYTWDIAWMYKLVTDTSTTGLQFDKAFHRATCTWEGKVTTEKGGASHPAAINDPTMNWNASPPLL